MKKRRFFLIAVTVFLLGGILIFSCKKSNTEDPNLTYIKNFYGVNIVHSFICLDPTNDTKSLQVDLVWDEKGVATYTTKEITRDTVVEHNARLFMPSSEFDVLKGIIAPTKMVKTTFLMFSNGQLEPVSDINGCHPYYTCSCGATPDAKYENGVFQFWYCGSCNAPYYLIYHSCDGSSQAPPLIGWQTE